MRLSLDFKIPNDPAGRRAPTPTLEVERVDDCTIRLRLVDQPTGLQRQVVGYIDIDRDILMVSLNQLR